VDIALSNEPRLYECTWLAFAEESFPTCAIELIGLHAVRPACFKLLGCAQTGLRAEQQ
jgi:hypothetical protein